MRRLDEEVYLLRTAKDHLERTLATVDANVSSLDFEIRRLFQASDDAVYEGVLGILSRTVQVIEAAVYVPPSKGGEPWTRAALIGPDKRLPAALHPLEHALTRCALKEKEIATLPELLAEGAEAGGPEPDAAFLIASPLLTLDRELTAMLVIADLPFAAMNQQSAHMVNIVCRWAARLLAMKSAHASGRARMLHGSTRTMICYSSEIPEALRLVWEAWTTLRIASYVIVFRPAPEGPRLDQAAFEKAVGSLLRNSDILAWRQGPDEPHIVAVLPLTGERGARICLERIVSMPGVTGDLIAISDCPSLADLERGVDQSICGKTSKTSGAAT
jgi:hypothetical protein